MSSVPAPGHHGEGRVRPHHGRAQPTVVRVSRPSDIVEDCPSRLFVRAAWVLPVAAGLFASGFVMGVADAYLSESSDLTGVALLWFVMAWVGIIGTIGSGMILLGSAARWLSHRAQPGPHAEPARGTRATFRLLGAEAVLLLVTIAGGLLFGLYLVPVLIALAVVDAVLATRARSAGRARRRDGD